MSDDQFPREMLGGPGGRLHDRSLPGVPAEEAARADLQRRLEAVTRVVLRPLASPLPLGFLALAAATLLTSALQLGWLAPDQQRPVALALIAFVVPLQLLASILGYLSRDGVAGTGMGILAGTWLTTGLVQLTSPPGSTSDGPVRRRRLRRPGRRARGRAGQARPPHPAPGQGQDVHRGHPARPGHGRPPRARRAPAAVTTAPSRPRAGACRAPGPRAAARSAAVQVVQDLPGHPQVHLELLVGLGVVPDHLGGEVADVTVVRPVQGELALLDLEQPGLGRLTHEPAVLPAQLVVAGRPLGLGRGRANRRRHQADEQEQDHHPEWSPRHERLLWVEWNAEQRTGLGQGEDVGEVGDAGESVSPYRDTEGDAEERTGLGSDPEGADPGFSDATTEGTDSSGS